MRLTLVIWMVAAGVVGLSSCFRVPYEGLRPFPLEDMADERVLGDFAINLQITDAVSRFAVRRPEPRVLADAQIAAMVEYVRQHGRGEVELVAEASATDEATHRLAHNALQLFPYLGLDTAPAQLGHAALEALQARLGADAVYEKAEARSEEAVGASDFLPELAGDIAVLSLGRVEADTADRVLAVLSQWAAGNPTPRAVVLDLSRAHFVQVEATSRLFGVFAPGQTLCEVVYRNEENGEVERRAWGGATGWAAQKYATLPVYAVTSEATSLFAQAFVHALRHHRSARILGGPTRGDGRGMRFYDLPWQARFGFTVFDVIGTDGKPLAERPVIPDVCWGEQGLVRVKERSAEGLRAACPTPRADFDKAAALDYIRQELAAPQPAGNAGERPLEHGEKQG